MSYSFGERSLKLLNECAEPLQIILLDAIQIFNFSIIEGHRTEDRQNEMFRTGRSKTPWPQSKHNAWPSLAVDIAPYPIVWPDPLRNPSTWQKHLGRFYYMAGVVKSCAYARKIKIRWGGDFNRDDDLTNDSFIDLPHFELDMSI